MLVDSEVALFARKYAEIAEQCGLDALTSWILSLKKQGGVWEAEWPSHYSPNMVETQLVTLIGEVVVDPETWCEFSGELLFRLKRLSAHLLRLDDQED